MASRKPHRYHIPLVPPSDAGTSITNASSLPLDHELDNAAIWDPDASQRRTQLEGGAQGQVDQKIEDVDKWIQDLYNEDEAVREALAEGIRTTGLTQRYFEEKTVTASSTGLSNSAQLSGPPMSDDHPFPTFGDISRAQRRELGLPANSPIGPRAGGPSRPPVVGQSVHNRTQLVGPNRAQVAGPNIAQGPAKQSISQQQASNNRVIGLKKLEGPAQDMRKLNDGDILARDHPREPTDSYLFPVRAKERAQGKNEKNSDMESRILGFDRLHVLAIADRTDTHMKFPHDEPQDWADERKTVRLNRIRIWGTRQAVERARKFLIYLNKHADRDVQSTAKKTIGWAKVKALPNQRHREAMVKYEKEMEEKGRFRQQHDESELFPFVGVFDWPPTEVNPTDVLGMNYEALDPIRLEHEVYILYSKKRSCFRVLGYSNDSIEKSLDRLYTVFCEITARNRNQIQYTLVNPPDVFQPQIRFDGGHGMHAILEPYKPGHDSLGVETFLGDDGTLPHDQNWPTRRNIIRLANDSYIKSALDSSLKDIYYLRIYKRAKNIHHGLEEYMGMVRAKLTRSDIIRHFGSNAVGLALLEYCKSNTVFRGEKQGNKIFNCGNPHKQVYEPETGRVSIEMEPSFSSSMWVLVIRKPNPPVEMKLEVDFELKPSGKYQPKAQRWLKVPRAEGRNVTSIVNKRMPLDLKMVDLQDGVTYQFDLTLGQAIPELERMPILTEFVRHLELVDDAKDGTMKRVSYIALPGIKVMSITTKKKYPYYFSGTPYVFEVTQYEHIRSRDEAARRKNLNEGGFPADFRQHTTNDILWGVSLYSADWDATFAKQVALRIGCTGDWSPNIEEFLSATGKSIHDHGVKNPPSEASLNDKPLDGFGELKAKIQECIKIIAIVKKKVLGDKSRQFLDAPSEHMLKQRVPETVLIDTSIEDIETPDFEYENSVFDDEDYVIDEPEDTFARLPVVRRNLTAGERLARKKENGKDKDASEITDTTSIYGDSEYSYAMKEQDGINSDTGSRYGDSEFSFAEKRRTGLI
ncbi:hypothetical protein H072_3177 [Dactylellina haptotyla CBS 200.50]|uniref:DUF7905 domain-containing protein n=1 Tax=Dactylellina haptotyla (strain CBS 200.50) TaxID=1284197 RepID=S8C5B1_DACHA|nr:hypothetical protein H072_3177 [Dactylellina haptotyla CBS 200.50]